MTRSQETDDGLLDGITEYAYHASHAPVSVRADECYWLEIKNAGGGVCEWYWSVARPADGLSVQDGALMSLNGFDEADRKTDDLAFCLDTAIGGASYCGPAAVNDECESRIPIGEGEYPFSTIGATLWGFEGCNYYGDCCDSELGPQQIYHDVWYEYTAPCAGMLTVDVCDSDYDTILTLYEFPNSQYCGGYFFGCSDDGCGTEPRDAFFDCSYAEDRCVRHACWELAHFVAPARCREYFTSQSDPYCVELASMLCREPSGVQSELFAGVDKDQTYLLRLGGYGIDDGRDLSARPDCVSRACTLDPTCCTEGWDSSCDRLAALTCFGDAGSGVLRLQLGAIPPIRQNLQDVYEFLNCFGGSCANPPCDPPVYPEPCCLSHDFDHDGDVDVYDFTDYLAPMMTGP